MENFIKGGGVPDLSTVLSTDNLIMSLSFFDYYPY